MPDRPIPLLGSISLDSVQHIEHSLDAGFAGSRIVGLDGELQQRAGRPSHDIRIKGVLFGESASENLGTLQTATTTGEELTFSADISSALDLQKVVIREMRAEQLAGEPSRVRYELLLRESPPLPPPAEVSAFGGLDGFGLGDLGLDLGALQDLASLAGDIASAISTAIEAVGALEDIAGLIEGFDGLMDPLGDLVDRTRATGDQFREVTRTFGEAFR
jgi:hypothetical protein